MKHGIANWITTRHLMRVTLLLLLSWSSMIAAQSVSITAPVTLRGKIGSLEGQNLIITGPSGEVKVTVTDKTVIRSEVAIKFTEIKAGMYLGTTAIKQTDGNFLASEVHIFSEDQRGTGEGHRPLGSSPQSGATMTNASVDHVEDVAVQDIKGRIMTLKYTGGEVKVVVPPDIPIVNRVLADRGALRPGVEVSVQAVRGADGALMASQITARAMRR
jgi:hypothetical protein